MIYEQIFDQFRFIERPQSNPYVILQLGLAQYQDYCLKSPEHPPYQFGSPRRLIGPFNYPLLDLPTPIYCTREQVIFEWEDLADLVKQRLFDWQPPQLNFPLLGNFTKIPTDGWGYMLQFELGLITIYAVLLETGATYRHSHRLWSFTQADAPNCYFESVHIKEIQTQFYCFSVSDVNRAIQRIQAKITLFYPD